MENTNSNKHNGNQTYGQTTRYTTQATNTMETANLEQSKGKTQTGNLTRLIHEQQMALPCMHQDPME
jgi:hypothetical protein